MAEYRYTLKKLLKDWMLVIAMLTGVGIYLIYYNIPALHFAGPALLSFVQWLQPVLLFSMLFLSFCKIEPQQMRPHNWMTWLLLAQALVFIGLAAVILCFNSDFIARWRIPLEAAMLCIICPTATACAVVTGKLGGNMAGVVTYTVLINLVVAVLVPAVVPLLYPGDTSFIVAFRTILGRVFPMLIMPCICAWVVRYVTPKLHAWLVQYTGLSFYIWASALTLAITMSTRAIIHSGAGAGILTGIAIASLLSCIFQFWFGKTVGAKYDCRISGGQAMGQKNTVFAIWMGYTFMDPVVSVAGGFYSIWHNIFNSWQLYRRRKEIEINNLKQRQ